MDSRHPLPRRWLMTDERIGDRLWDGLTRLPEGGGGVVFRHNRTPAAERRRLFDRVAEVARRRGHILLLAGPAKEALAWGAAGSHGRGPGGGLRTAPAHDLAELRAAEAWGAALAFVSPVYPTRSHPGAPALGPESFAALAAAARIPVVALGGMDETRWRALAARGGHGWAGIDGWCEEPPPSLRD